MKMSSLREFAEVLVSVPQVLNQYVLARIGELSGTDLQVLKKWITYSEATSVHQMLEKFRDVSVKEQAKRELMQQLGRAPTSGPPSTWELMSEFSEHP